jgi:hypothetical protein
MTKNNVVWVETSNLCFNPLWIEKNISNCWEYSCLMTEISVYGILSPIEISHDNVVINGNTRLQIAIDLNMTKVPVSLYQDDKMNELITSSIRPSELVKILEVFYTKYGLKYSTRYNKKGLPKLLISLRKLIIGGNKRVQLMYQLQENSKQIRKSYPIETDEIWEQLDSFNISLKEGNERLKALIKRRFTMDYTLDYKIAS